MLHCAFHAPVTVLVGLGFPLRIDGIMQAIGLLDNQPASQRDEAFHATLAACRDALAGKGDMEDARAVFCAFARRRGILVDDQWIEPELAGAARAAALAR